MSDLSTDPPPVHTVTMTAAEAATVVRDRLARRRYRRSVTAPRRPAAPAPVELRQTRCHCGRVHTVAAPVGGATSVRCHACLHTFKVGGDR